MIHLLQNKRPGRTLVPRERTKSARTQREAVFFNIFDISRSSLRHAFKFR
jgi:hypothetical protein